MWVKDELKNALGEYGVTLNKLNEFLMREGTTLDEKINYVFEEKWLSNIINT